MQLVQAQPICKNLGFGIVYRSKGLDGPNPLELKFGLIITIFTLFIRLYHIQDESGSNYLQRFKSIKSNGMDSTLKLTFIFGSSILRFDE